MVSNGISIFAWYDQSNEDLEWCMKQVVSSADWSPTIILEKGYNLTNLMLRNSPSPSNSNTHLSHIGFKGVIDCSLTAMKESEGLKKLGLLNFIAFNLYTNPVIRLMEKRLMPRESIVNILTMGGLRTIICKNIIIIGYGVMGQTISNTLRHANCTVYVVEIDPIKALKASIDGFKVRKIEEIVKVADYIICCSNSQMVISSDILKIIKDEAFICNMGNENQEIDVNWIRANCITKPVSKHLEKATLKHRPKSFFFLCKGMQASKFLQATPPIVESVKCLASLLAIMEMNMSKGTKYDFNTYSLPIDIDKFNAKLHLEDFNVAVSESKH
ncbi:MAG: S-adenosylhomocysteine hydrolase-like protein 1 [Marteilia pararefringens]